MKLDRKGAARGKYGLVNHRKLDEIAKGANMEQTQEVLNSIAVLQRYGVYDPCDTLETECFVIKLKDKYARAALIAYAGSAGDDGEHEYRRDVRNLADRAGPLHAHCKKPD